MKILLLITISIASCFYAHTQHRARDFGVRVGVMNTGKLNSITDVEGVLVGHVTLIEGTAIRTGVTAILPHEGMDVA